MAGQEAGVVVNDEITIIGWDDDPDTKKLRAAFDLNHVRYKYWPDRTPKKPAQQVITLAKVDGVTLDFLGWNEPAVRFCVEQHDLPYIIEH